MGSSPPEHHVDTPSRGASHKRPPAVQFAILLSALLALCQPRASSGDPHHGHVSRHHARHTATATGGHPLHLLMYCRHVLGNTTHVHQHALRDVIQIMQFQARLMREHQVYLEHRNQQPDDHPGWAEAFNDSMSEQDHIRLQEKHKAERDALEKKAEGMLASLKKAGLVPDDVTLKFMTNCVMGRLNPHLFPHQPTVSFMLQYFKRPWSIEQWVTQMQRCGNHTELLVNVDNPDDHAEWADWVNRTRGYVVPVFSANLHEPRGYNRLSELARGKLLVIFQDDELPTDLDCQWLGDVIKIFERWPSVGAVGNRGFVWDKISGDKGGVHHPNGGMFFRDPVTKIPMQFVDKADFAPFTIRKSAFRSLGGLDETAGEPGECGHWADWDLNYRLWAAGWQLAYYMVPRAGDGHDSGTHRPDKAERCWGRQGFLTQTHFADRWDWGETLTRHVRYLNLHLLEGAYTSCPFAGGCDVAQYAPQRKRLRH